MIFYHIAKGRHAESILAKGLIPGHRRGITCNGDKHKKVFVTNDVDKIIKWQAGPAWIKKHKCVLVHVDMTGVRMDPVQYRCGMTYTISDFEFTTDRIDPKRIVKIEPIQI